MSREDTTTVIDFRTDASETDEQPEKRPSTHDAPAGWRPAFPGYLVVLLLGLCLFVVGLVLRATPPV